VYKTISLKNAYKDELLLLIRMKVKEGWTQDGAIAFSKGYYRTVMVKK